MVWCKVRTAWLGALLAALGAWPAAAEDLPFVFRDVSDEVGLAEPLKGMMGHAAAWGDLNGNGWIDLFVGTFADRPAENYIAGGARGPVPNVLLLNEGGKFKPVQHDVMAWHGRASGAVIADLDNDGLPEIYVANAGRLGKENRLYHNRGGKMVDVTGKVGAPVDLPDAARSAVAFDYDGDGLLDLLVVATVRRDATKLFRNLGNMRFEESDAIPGDAQGLGVAVGDVTGNGWPDVFIGGCNRLFVNQGGGRFREASELGLETNFRAEDDAPSCGVAFGDFDRDGKLDLVIGNHTKRPWADPVPVRLFRNLGSKVDRVAFEEVTEKVGLPKLPMRAPHVELRDFNNDGWPDLYASIVVVKDGRHYPAVFKNLGAKRGQLPKFQETALVHRPEFPAADDFVPSEGTGAFYDRLVRNYRVVYFAPGPSGDFDNDGRLDIFLPNWFPTRPSLLLKNETPAGNWLVVEVVGGGGVNRMGIGSMVRAYRAGQAGKAEAMLASEEISAAYGYASGQPALAHLGLADEASCDIVVTLPHGTGEIVRKGVEANQRLKVAVEQ